MADRELEAERRQDHAADEREMQQRIGESRDLVLLEPRWHCLEPVFGGVGNSIEVRPPEQRDQHHGHQGQPDGLEVRVDRVRADLRRSHADS
jgi:hypothetical protein